MRGLLKNSFLITGCVLITLACEDEPEFVIPKPPDNITLSESVYCIVDAIHQSEDRVRVNIYVSDLTEADNIFQFPATVPGTYQLLNYGRFISDFKAYNKDNQPINVTQLNVNQYSISEPKEVYMFQYYVKDTWDSELDDEIYRMAGTSLEADHILLNTFAAIGYPKTQQDRKYYLQLLIPDNWIVGTSLKQENGIYWESDYGSFVDSPVLAGTITESHKKVGGADIGVYNCSPAESTSGIYDAAKVITYLEEVLDDAQAFLKGIPVDRYNFLFHWEGSDGALEHSYSSVFVLPDRAIDEYTIKHFAAHEFFHIVTPLNIHSEIIEDFNYSEPTPSKHLWFYEGVTEWASNIMRYRNGSITLSEQLGAFKREYANSRRYDVNSSLLDIGALAYTPKGGQLYGNVYNEAALAAAMLDIRLLQLSNGQYGLRELLLDLMIEYGTDAPFSEEGFNEKLVSMSYPEIGDFLNRYIKGIEELPYQEYFLSIGIETEFANEGVLLTKTLNPNTQQTFLFDQWSKNL